MSNRTPPAQASDEPPCPFCNGAPRHLRKLEGIYVEALICDACNFGLAPEKWRQRAAISSQASDEPMRAAFEAWAELSEYRKRGIQHDVIGWYYFDSEIDARWDAWKAAIATKVMPQPSGNTGDLSPRATADVERDAARWRAFIGSARIKMQGSAGIVNPQFNYAHLGMEIWTTFGRDYSQKLLDQMDADNALGREWLTKYADIAIEAQRAATKPGETNE